MDRILKLIIRGYSGLNWATKNVCPHSNPRVPVNVNLFWKICVVIKWRISRWDPPGLIKWILDPRANIPTGREEETDRREDHVKLKAETGVMEPQSNRQEKNLSLEPLEEVWPPNSLVIDFWSPDLWEKVSLVSSHCCCCSVTKSCLTFWHPMDCSTPGFPVLH